MMSKDTLVYLWDKLYVEYMYCASTYGLQKIAGLHVSTWDSIFMIYVVQPVWWNHVSGNGNAYVSFIYLGQRIAVCIGMGELCF